jgi:polyhydroxyalkanoic acid synthase PhaR subunit
MSSPDNQSSRRPPDPFELWRQIYETNERAWNTILERTVSSPAFAESSGKFLETFLSAQKTVRDNMRTYLEQVNLPTREDVSRLGELIVSLEEKVDQLDDRLSAIEATLRSQASAASAERPPATTSQPPQRLATSRARRRSSSRETAP